MTLKHSYVIFMNIKKIVKVYIRNQETVLKLIIIFKKNFSHIFVVYIKKKHYAILVKI